MTRGRLELTLVLIATCTLPHTVKGAPAAVRLLRELAGKSLPAELQDDVAASLQRRDRKP